MQSPERPKGRPVGRTGPRLQLDVAGLNRLRADAGYSVPELAVMAGIGVQTLKANIADGQVSARIARKLAHVLGCPPAWIARPPICRTCGQYMADEYGPWEQSEPDGMGPADE